MSRTSLGAFLMWMSGVLIGLSGPKVYGWVPLAGCILGVIGVFYINGVEVNTDQEN